MINHHIVDLPLNVFFSIGRPGPTELVVPGPTELVVPGPTGLVVPGPTGLA